MSIDQDSIIVTLKASQLDLFAENRRLERQLAEEKARIDCTTNNGWLSDDLECAREDGPACWKHLLAEAQRKLLKYGSHAGGCHRIDPASGPPLKGQPHMHRGVDCDDVHPCDCGWTETRVAILGES